MLHSLGHVGARGGRGLLVHRRTGKAAVAGRTIEVARGVGQVQHGANGLRAVAFLVGRQVQVNTAVAVVLTGRTGGPSQAGLLDQLRIELRDLRAPLGRAVLHGVGQVRPHGAHGVHGAVGQGDLVGTGHIEVDAGLNKLVVGNGRQVALL